jgi:hypothetical protein
MIGPYLRVGKDHFTFALHRGMVEMAGDVPPRAANLRAASRSISALRASRIGALFSTKPVYSCAVLMRSSSKAMVVRKEVSPLSRIDQLMLCLPHHLGGLDSCGSVL